MFGEAICQTSQRERQTNLLLCHMLLNKLTKLKQETGH